MPRPYMLEVHSHPTTVSDDLWIQWYLEEHLRDMVYFKVSRTAAFYRSSSEVLTTNNVILDGTEKWPYMALYQTDLKHSLEGPEFKDNVRKESKLFNGGSQYDAGEFLTKGGQLVEILGNYEHNEDFAPHVVHVKISGEEVESKLQFQHVNAVSVLEGYRRTLLYRQTTKWSRDEEDPVPTVVLIHEFESLDPGQLPHVKTEMEAIQTTKDCAFQLRSFELLESEGFGGVCRTPERL